MKLKYCPDLVSDMAECDANYIRLSRLLGQLAGEDQLEIQVDAGAAAGTRLCLAVLERSPYTLLIKIDLDMSDIFCKSRLPLWPGMQVRVYHDVKTAEVVMLQGREQFKGRYDYPNLQMYHPDEKAQANRFLGELLSLCLSRGHVPSAITVADRI